MEGEECELLATGPVASFMNLNETASLTLLRIEMRNWGLLASS
jgi:hypothetical protein